MRTTQKHLVTLAFLLLLFLLLVLPGCAFEDIDRRAFVTAIGIDQSEVPDNKYTLILKISHSKNDPKDVGSQSTLLKVNCNSISEGLERLRSMSDQKLEYGHVKVLLYGEEVAKQDLTLSLDYLMKRPDLQKMAYLGIAKPNSYKLLQVKPKEEAVAGSFYFFSFERSRTQSPYVAPVPLYDAYRRITTPGLDLALPVLELDQGILQINKTALFDKKHLRLELTSEESKLLKLITTGNRDQTMTLSAKNKTYTVTTEKGKTSFQLTEENHVPTAILKIKLRGTLIEKLEEQSTVTDVTKHDLESKAQVDLQNKIEKLLVKMSSKNLDPIGFGLRYRSRHFDHANDTTTWQAVYPHLRFHVMVDYQFKNI